MPKPEVSEECQELIHSLLLETDGRIIDEIRRSHDCKPLREKLLNELDVLEMVRTRLIVRLSTD